MPAGGSISALSIGGQDFAVASDCDVSLKMGGTKPTTHRNGDGTTRVTGAREDWALSDIDVSIDASENQLDFLQSVANALELVPCTITLIDGTIYGGSGIVADDRSFSTAKSVMRLSLMGSGQLTKQPDNPIPAFLRALF
jgi:hypothetical protein